MLPRPPCCRNSALFTAPWWLLTYAVRLSSLRTMFAGSPSGVPSRRSGRTLVSDGSRPRYCHIRDRAQLSADGAGARLPQQYRVGWVKRALNPSYWLLATGYWRLAPGYWLLATGYWLLATGYWLLATGYWLLA